MIVKHSFVSGKADSLDTGLIQPSHWNDEHVITNPDSANDFWTDDFIFEVQTPGGALSVGANTITLTPVPKGINGSDANHYIYISGGTGSPEACLITGGTAISEAATGTIIVICANVHSGAWTILSASAGIQEAISQSLHNNYERVMVSTGEKNIYALTVIPWKVFVCGANRYSTILKNQSTTAGVFRLDSFFGSDFSRACGLSNLTIVSSAVGRLTVDVSAAAVFIYGTGYGTVINFITIRNHRIGVHFAGPIYSVLDNFVIEFFGLAGIYHEYGDLNWITNGRISNLLCESTPVAGASGIWFINFGGVFVENVDVTKTIHGVKLQPTIGKACSYGFFTNVLADTCSSHGWYFDINTTGTINTIQCVDCWSSFNGFDSVSATWNTTARGIYINGTEVQPNGITFLGGRSRFNGGSGIDTVGGIWLKFIGMEINANSQQALNGFAGIGISSTSSHVIIHGCQVGNYGVGGPATPKQGTGIYITGAPANYISICNNDLTDNNQVSLVHGEFAASAVIDITNNLGVDGVWISLASAASITLSSAHSLYLITGTVPVATIVGGFSGRHISLVFTDAASGGVTTGGNIGKIVTTTQNQKLDGVFNGVMWFF